MFAEQTRETPGKTLAPGQLLRFWFLTHTHFVEHVARSSNVKVYMGRPAHPPFVTREPIFELLMPDLKRL